nr:MAG TPA: hypothetical protein [Caudoviricetes sp.]
MEMTYILYGLMLLLGVIAGVVITGYNYNHRKVDGFITFFNAEDMEMPMLEMNTEDFKKKTIIVLRKKSVRK